MILNAELRTKIVEDIVAEVKRQEEQLAERHLQEWVALTLTNLGYKTYREARYPSEPAKGYSYQAIDVVSTDGTDELWLEIKLIRDLPSYGLNRTKTAPGGQGIQTAIEADFHKLQALPPGSERWFLCVGVFDDFNSSTRAPLATTLAGEPQVQELVAPNSILHDCLQIAFWWKKTE